MNNRVPWVFFWPIFTLLNFNFIFWYVPRRIQSASEQWQDLQEAGKALEDHGQRLQALGMRLAGLTTEHQITSTPKGHYPRPIEMSPIGGADTPLELSTVLQHRVVPLATRAPVTAALDKLQTLLTTTATGGLEGRTPFYYILFYFRIYLLNSWY